MRALSWLVLLCALALAASGSKSPEPESAAGAEPGAGDPSDDGAAPEGDTPAEESPPADEETAPEEGESAAPDESGEEAAAEEEGTEDEGPAPSADLQAYMGSAPSTPEYKTVQANMDKFKFCYLDAMRSNPDLQGEIRVRFTVNKKGKVPKVKAVKNELNADVETCIIKLFKKLQFPKRDSNRTVEYPFKFIPAP